MSLKNLKIGSRSSRLAVIQVGEVIGLLKSQGHVPTVDRQSFETAGDRDKTTSLTVNSNDNFFTDTLDEAVLNGQIDVAVHSAKDLPQVLKDGLTIFALTQSLDETDAFVGRCSIRELSAGAKIGTSSLLRRKAIESLNATARLVDIRGTIEERLELIEQGEVDGIIVATCALKRLKLDHLIKDILPYETTALQGQLAVVGRSKDFYWREVFSSIDVRLGFGEVDLVGAGPGDPDLITIKGVDSLKNADVIFYDYLISQRLLDYAPRAEKIDVGKRKGEHALAQSELCRMLKRFALEGKKVVRLKGGDPLIFGRGGEEIDYLQSYHIRVNVIPGVSSATGLPSGLGIPLTSRDLSSSVAFVSGHGADSKERPSSIPVPRTETIVFLMGITRLGDIISSLLVSGWARSTPIIIISRGTTRQERVICGTIGNIEELAARHVPEPPALVVVGPTVNFWERRKKLGSTVLYLGTNPGKFRFLGRIIPFPMIEISPIQFRPETVRNLADRLGQYQLVLLTSRFAVKYFFEMIKDQNFSLDYLSKIPFAVIGRETAEALRKSGVEPKIEARSETSQGVLSEMEAVLSLKGMNIFFPRSSLPNPFLKTELTKRGARVDELSIYENKKPPRKNLPAEHVSTVFFTSPSTVRNFLQDYDTIPSAWEILARGPLTKAALKQAGYDRCLLYGE